MSPVTLRQLEVFRSVVDAGSFGAAAAALRISQPAVSMHIRALEIHLRQAVFERRRGRPPVLTGIGRQIYDHAGNVLAEAEPMLRDARALRAARENVLSFAAQRFVGNYLLVKPLAAFAKANPGVEIIANIGPLDQAIEKIRHRDVDLGLFLARGVVEGIESRVLGRQKLAFVAGRDHPLASRRRLALGDLAGHPFIGPVRGTGYERLLRDAFGDIGFAGYSTVTQSQNTLIRRELLLSGTGFSCVLRSAWAADLRSGRLVELALPGAPPSLEVRIGCPADRPTSAASEKFADYLDTLSASGKFDG